VIDLSVEFSPGEFVAILGRNGCGKTLTLHTSRPQGAFARPEYVLMAPHCRSSPAAPSPAGWAS